MRPAGPRLMGTDECDLLARWKLAMQASCDSRLSRTDIAVLMAITNRINETGTAWPGLNLIAKDAKADRSTATRAVSRLCECGYLQRDSGDRTRSNVYRMGRCEVTPSRESTPRREATPKVGVGPHPEVGVGLSLESTQLNLPTEQPAIVKRATRLSRPKVTYQQWEESLSDEAAKALSAKVDGYLVAIKVPRGIGELFYAWATQYWRDKPNRYRDWSATIMKVAAT